MNAYNAKEFPFHRAFLFFGLLFGIVWLFLIPPFQGPDEFGHFGRAYMLSEGKLKIDVDPPSGRSGNYLPASIRELENTLQSREIAGRSGVKQNPDALVAAANIKLKPETSLFYDSIAYYPPVAYAPQVAAITIARMMDMPVLYIYYAARLGSFIFFIVTMYFLIKHIRILKLSLLTIALMPISIQQSVIVSADCVTIVSILMMVCYVVNMTFYDGNKVIGPKDMVIFYLLCALIALSKGPYVILVLLYFIIPKKRFRSDSVYWTCGIGMVLVGVLLMAAWKFSQTDLSTAKTVSSIIGVTPGKNTDPFHILYRVFYTMFSVYLAKSTFWLGWMDVRLPFIFLAVYTCLMLWPLFVPDVTVDDRVAQLRKAGFVIIAFIFWIWTAYHISMYLTEPQKPEGKILGMQGRYFVRLLYPLLVGIYLIVPHSMRVRFSKLPLCTERIIKGHLALLACLLAVATWYIGVRYYV
jgi:uncharacterized membrane protein